ncbi:MAG TPA: glycosyltransferase family 2 protein [Micromonosporaceae bacterium]|jgi:glycosyltransferase involved in cell wall biosynthesis|nr:glycosyltransferase family 2 protein [Micromonosporaceae bacterium]
MSHAPTPPGPVRVVRVDVDEPLPDISATRLEGGRYEGAFVVVAHLGRPVGHFEMELDRDVSAAELKELIALRLGNAAWPGIDRPAVVNSRLPSITVVIPSAFQRADLLARCVSAVCAQDYPSFEVIVSDNRPDNGPQRAEHWRRLMADPRVRVVAEPLRGSSAARNRGIALAHGEVIAFLDDDAVPIQGWLMAVGRRFALDPETDAVTGLLLPYELETPAQVLFERSGSKVPHRYEVLCLEGGPATRSGGRQRGRFEIAAWHPDRPSVPAENYLIYRVGRFGMGANMSFRTETLRNLGGFDESMGIGTPSLGGVELHFFIRMLFAGGRMTFDPEVVMYHSHVRDYGELRHKLYSYGCGYTAMLTALSLEDPRHLVGLSRNAVQAMRLFGRKFFAERTAAAAEGYFPSDLSRAEMRGFAVGPWRYIYSRISTRRARSAIAVGRAVVSR